MTGWLLLLVWGMDVHRFPFPSLPHPPSPRHASPLLLCRAAVDVEEIGKLHHRAAYIWSKTGRRGASSLHFPCLLPLHAPSRRGVRRVRERHTRRQGSGGSPSCCRRLEMSTLGLGSLCYDTIFTISKTAPPISPSSTCPSREGTATVLYLGLQITDAKHSVPLPLPSYHSPRHSKPAPTWL